MSRAFDFSTASVTAEPVAKFSRLSQSAVLLFLFICMVALESRVALGMSVALLALQKRCRIWTLLFLVPFSAFVAMKLLLSAVMPTDESYSAFPFAPLIGIREASTVALTFTMLIVGYRFLHRLYLYSSSMWLLFSFSLANWAVHAYQFSELFPATPDNTQLLSLYFLFICVARGRGVVVPLSLAMTLVMSAGLDSSFTAIATIIIWLAFIARIFQIKRVQFPFRASVAIIICILMVGSLFAAYINLRATGNNGGDRAILAGFGYDVIARYPLLGSPLGRPIVPLEAIQELNWSQYLVGSDASGKTFNTYGLSFHNSFIYLLSRFGLFGLAAIFSIIALVPRRAQLVDVMFAAVPLVFAGANVVIEGLRAGPAFGLVLGSIISYGVRVKAHRLGEEINGRERESVRPAATSTKAVDSLT